MPKLTVQDNHPATCNHIIVNVGEEEKKITTLDELQTSKQLNRPQWLRKIQKLIDKQQLKTTDAARKFLQGKNI